MKHASAKTLQRHILEQQRQHPTATGEFSWLLSGITLATKMIAAQVRRIGLGDLRGATGRENVQGETVLKMDRYADDVLCDCLGYRETVGIMVSEENQEPVITKNGDQGKYIVLFDPLDGSSNLDCNVAVGTIFAVFARPPRPPGPAPSHPQSPQDSVPDVLQPGSKMLAAGYVLYSSSTVLAFTTGAGVHMFTLDPTIGAYVLSSEHVKMPPTSPIVSCNEANALSFPAGVQEYLAWTKRPEAGPYSSRYVGSLVADFHRTLLKGGVFLYPATQKAPNGKLRLLYECNPMAFLAEQAGGIASDGTQRILDKVPTSLHERTPFYVGSRDEVARVLGYLAAGGPPTAP
ncbi:MAG TPA: class 1 fructose-bisphosphatase [Polyangia bacterium]